MTELPITLYILHYTLYYIIYIIRYTLNVTYYKLKKIVVPM
jgi:hypothetical protein